MRHVFTKAGHFIEQDGVRTVAGPQVKLPCCQPKDDPSVWGRALWDELHSAPKMPAYFASRIPCQECRTDFLKYCEDFPAPEGDQFHEWTVQYHNFVNKKLGKAEWSQ